VRVARVYVYRYAITEKEGEGMNQQIRKDKEQTVSEISEKINNSSSTIVAEYRGLTVAEVTELRRLLHEVNSEMKVYKNTLVDLAAESLGLDDLRNVMAGPNALVFGEDETAAAGVLAKYAKKHKSLIVKGGVVDGKVVDADTVAELSALPNREGMLSMLLSVLNAPISSFARVVQAVVDSRTGTPAQESTTETAA
jgi:large subunit ribosomal protein L10